MSGNAPVSTLRIHTAADRADIFQRNYGRPLKFDESLKAWIVFDPETVSKLLRNPAILACPLAESLARLGELHGVPLPDLTALAGRLSLGLNGAEHQIVRRDTARLLAKSQRRVAARLPELVDTHFAPVAHASEVEIVGECVAPLVAALFSEIVGSNETIAFHPRVVGRIFDRFAGVGTLARLDAELGAMRKQLVALDVEDPDLALTVITIGRDALHATLSESIASIARPGGTLDSIAIPAIPPATGVGVTERTVGEPMSVDGVDLKKGDRLRLYFHGFADRPADADKLFMFGAGVHSCLGRKLSVDVWQALAGFLGRIHRRIELVGYAVFPDPIFTMPQYVRVRLS